MEDEECANSDAHFQEELESLKTSTCEADGKINLNKIYR